MFSRLKSQHYLRLNGKLLKKKNERFRQKQQ